MMDVRSTFLAILTLRDDRLFFCKKMTALNQMRFQPAIATDGYCEHKRCVNILAWWKGGTCLGTKRGNRPLTPINQQLMENKNY